MLRLSGWALTLAAVLVLGACQAFIDSKLVQEFPLTKFKAENMLDQGIRAYDDGNYKVAVRNIQGALDAGLTTHSQARAHKYLAFIDCISGQQAQCREEFRKALEIEPNLELKTEETGHPIWGPVFRSVKAEMHAKQ
jgi:Tfp pilus assembly protein PilF